MRSDYITYLRGGEAHFVKDLAKEMIRFFGEHGFSVRFSSDLGRVYLQWCALAREWSLRVPNREGKIAQEPAPERLSHIKHAGLLGFTICKTRPIAKLDPLTAEDIAMFEALGWEHSTKLDKEQQDLIRAYPFAYCALAIAEGLFLAYQLTRGGSPRFHGPDTPRTRHFHRNLAHFMSDGSLSAEALYMIFKTMDLFGYQAERKVPSIGAI